MTTRKLTLLGGILTSALAVHASSDYGPAYWRPACSGHWYTSGNGHNFAVIHDMEGYYLATISYFQNCNTTSSVYYCVNGKSDTSTDAPAGEITQMVSESNYAWHVGCWNTYMFGTEHEGFASSPSWYTEEMYQSSASLQRHLANTGGFAKDRNHIIAHGEWQNNAWRSWMSANWPGINTSCNTHTDPGSYWDWSHFMSLINQTHPTNQRSVPFNATCQNDDGRMDLYMVGNNNYAFHNYQTVANGGWNGFGLTSGSPQLIPGSIEARNEDGRLETFFIGGDGNVYHRYQDYVNGGWDGYFSLGSGGGGATALAVGQNADGRLEVFIIGADKHVYHKWQSAANTGWIDNWSQLGGWQLNGGLTVGYNADGRQQVFGIGTDGNCDSIWQTAVNGAWGNWNGFGGSPVTSVTCANNQDGRLEVFATVSGQVSHKWQTTPNGSWSANWSSMNWGAGGIVAQTDPDGRIELMAIGNPNGYVAHNYQNSANGSWNGFVKLLNQNFVASSLCFGKNQDGHLELFAVGSDTAVWHIWQTSPGGAWNSNGWSSMGGSWTKF